MSEPLHMGDGWVVCDKCRERVVQLPETECVDCQGCEHCGVIVGPEGQKRYEAGRDLPALWLLKYARSRAWKRYRRRR